MVFYDKDNHCTMNLNKDIKNMSSGEWWPGIAFFGKDEKNYLKVLE